MKRKKKGKVGSSFDSFLAEQRAAAAIGRQLRLELV